MQQMRSYVPEALRILFGLLIIALPQILVALVAAGLILAGIGALSLGHRMRQVEHPFASPQSNDWPQWRCQEPDRFTRWQRFGR